MKWILIGILIALVVGESGRRVRELLSTAKKLPAEFKRGKAAVDDPAGAAREVKGKVD